MSPTSYQAAPPRIVTIADESVRVKSPRNYARTLLARRFQIRRAQKTQQRHILANCGAIGESLSRKIVRAARILLSCEVRRKTLQGRLTSECVKTIRRKY